MQHPPPLSTRIAMANGVPCRRLIGPKQMQSQPDLLGSSKRRSDELMTVKFTKRMRTHTCGSMTTRSRRIRIMIGPSARHNCRSSFGNGGTTNRMQHTSGKNQEGLGLSIYRRGSRRIQRLEQYVRSDASRSPRMQLSIPKKNELTIHCLMKYQLVGDFLKKR